MLNQNKVIIMKRLNVILFSVVIAAAGFFSSCTEDDDPDGPQITFANGQTETTLAKGVTQWEINANITSIAGLDQVKIFQVTSGGEDQIGEAITSFTDKNDYDLKVTIPNIVEQTTIKIEATDKNNVTNKKNFIIKVTAAEVPATDKLIFYTGELKAQLGAQGSKLGSAFSTSNGAVYLTAAAKTNATKVDFIYYYKDDATVKAEFLSPKYAETAYASYVTGWTAKNETLFKDVTSSVNAAAFDAIVKTDDASVTAAATGFPTEQRVSDLAVGDVFAFKTAGNKLGLAKVTALATGTAGSITIEVKVQK
jgi:hypothetical protein